MSSVLALNASPSIAILRPRSGPRCRSSLPTTRRFCSSFTSITDVSSWKWYPELPASCFSACTSLGKQLCTTRPPLVTNVPASGTSSE